MSYKIISAKKNDNPDESKIPIKRDKTKGITTKNILKSDLNSIRHVESNKNKDVRPKKPSQFIGSIEPTPRVVNNKSYTIVKAVDNRRPSEEKENINNEQTLSSGQDRVSGKKSYTILKKQDSGIILCTAKKSEISKEKFTSQSKNLTGHVIKEVNSDLHKRKKFKGLMTNVIPQNNVIKSKSYTILKDKNIGKTGNNNPQDKVVMMPQVEKKEYQDFGTRNRSYTIIPREKNNLEKLLPTGIDVSVKAKENENQENIDKFEDIKTIVCQAMKFNEYSMGMNKQNKNNIPCQQIYNLQTSFESKMPSFFVIKSNEMLKGKRNTKNNLVVNIQEKKLNSCLKTRCLERTEDVNNKGPLLRSKYGVNKNWQKLQLKNIKVQEYIQHNNDQAESDKTTREIKRKPYLLGNSSAEYHKTTCDIHIPRIQFATIIPFLMPNNVFWWCSGSGNEVSSF